MKDELDLTVFHGDKDKSIGRQMIDAISDPMSFRTRIVGNAMLRTKGGSPEITMGQSADSAVDYLSMDSGIVDVISVAQADPHCFDNGVLHYGDAQRSAESAKELLGTIKPPSIKCKPPKDGGEAKSFKKNSTTTNLLWLKKICVSQVPASLFCGKARLYIQAQYGSDLGAWKWSPGLGDTPYLSFTSNGVVVNTNSGIYTDSKNRHWLITLGSTGAQITRLKANAAAEKLRASLSLAGVNHDKIEAYILAYSYPDKNMSFFISVPNIPAPDMLGYGWKFNWDGTSADIIQIDTVPVSGVRTDFKSTHFRISINRLDNPLGSDKTAEASNWSVVLTTVEGATTWHNTKWGQVIAFPTWDGTLGIFGSMLGNAFGNAPVYCFYKRNTLEVVRYQGNGGQSLVQYQSVSSPPSFCLEYGWTTDSTVNALSPNFGTVGLEGGSGERQTRTTTPFVSGFSCSSASAVVSTQSYSLTRYTLSAKMYNGTTSWTTGGNTDHTDPSSVADSGSMYYTTSSGGTPVYSSQPVITEETEVYTGNGGVDSSYLVSLSYSRYTYSGTHSESADVALIIPYSDAEAVYLYALKSTTENLTGTGGACNNVSTNGAAFIKHHIIYIYVSPGVYNQIPYFRYYGAGGGFLAGTPSTSAPPINTTTYETVCSTLVNSSGAHNFAPPESMSPFFAGEPNDSVSQTYDTHTSAVSGATFGHGVTQTGGFSWAGDPPPFLGWA